MEGNKIIKHPAFILFIVVILAFILRVYRLGEIPISLHGDEVGVGYNAYALLTSGIDEYGKKWPLVLRADVAPIIFYATIPSIAFFGPTEVAVRFPSVVVGTITILAFYFMTREFFRHIDASCAHSRFIPTLVALFLAISPWHIQISRIAHDASYALLIELIALWLFLRSVRFRNTIQFYLSFIFFAISFYAYHSARLTTPLLILGLIFMFKQQLKVTKRMFLVAGLLFGAIAFPIVFNILSKPFSQTRFSGINIFIHQPGESFYPFSLLPKFAFNFINQFNLHSLFFDSSGMRYFNISGVGLFYLMELPIILTGFIYVIRLEKWKWFLLYWVAISVLPGALTLGSPNGGRILLLLPVLTIISAIGVVGMFQLVTSKKYILFLSFSIAIVISISSAYFLHQYFNDSRDRYWVQWQFGAKEIAQTALNHEAAVDRIVISDSFKQEYVYILFYGQKDPRWLAMLPNKNRHSFIGYTAFGKYEFRAINWEKDRELPNTLLIAAVNEIPPNKIQTAITSPTGDLIAGSYLTK